MKIKLGLVLVLVVTISMTGNASAHKSEVAGDYKIEVGWKVEPPVVGIENAIEVIVTHATEFDKKQSASEEQTHTHNDESMETEHEEHDESMETEHEEHDESMETEHEEHDDHDSGEGISGLSNSLNIWITIGDDKTKLSLVESTEFPGVYHAEYLPIELGFPVIDVHGTIEKTEVDVQIHPEEVESLSTLPPLKQMKYGINPEDVQCKDGLDLFMRTFDGSAVCIGPQLSERLMSLGITDYF